MAQTTTAVDSTLAITGISSDGVTFTSVEGSLAKMTPGSQSRAVGKANTVDGDNPIVRKGKRDVMTVTIEGLYTPTASELFMVCKAIWEANGDCYVQWSYADTAELQQFSSSGKGFISSFDYPGVDADNANPIPFKCIVTIPGITVGTVPS